MLKASVEAADGALSIGGQSIAVTATRDPAELPWKKMGVDVVLDSIGGAYLEGNLNALADDGALILIGLMGGAKAEIALGALLSRRLRVIAAFP